MKLDHKIIKYIILFNSQFENFRFDLKEVLWCRKISHVVSPKQLSTFSICIMLKNIEQLSTFSICIMTLSFYNLFASQICKAWLCNHHVLKLFAIIKIFKKSSLNYAVLDLDFVIYCILIVTLCLCV